MACGLLAVCGQKAELRSFITDRKLFIMGLLGPLCPSFLTVMKLLRARNHTYFHGRNHPATLILAFVASLARIRARRMAPVGYRGVTMGPGSEFWFNTVIEILQISPSTPAPCRSAG